MIKIDAEKNIRLHREQLSYESIIKPIPICWKNYLESVEPDHDDIAFGKFQEIVLKAKTKLNIDSVGSIEDYMAVSVSFSACYHQDTLRFLVFIRMGLLGDIDFYASEPLYEVYNFSIKCTDAQEILNFYKYLVSCNSLNEAITLLQKKQDAENLLFRADSVV